MCMVKNNNPIINKVQKLADKVRYQIFINSKIVGHWHDVYTFLATRRHKTSPILHILTKILTKLISSKKKCLLHARY